MNLDLDMDSSNKTSIPKPGIDIFYHNFEL